MTDMENARAGDPGALNIWPKFTDHHTANTRAQATACTTCRHFYGSGRWSPCAWAAHRQPGRACRRWCEAENIWPT